jgi:hypothetical protein
MPFDGGLLFQAPRPHALVIGATAHIEAVLARLYHHLPAPVSHWWPTAVAAPPQPATGTLVVWGVDGLDRTQQQSLLAWLERHPGEVQVISVADRPVFPLVERGEFLDGLYYRLNAITATVPR